MHNLVKTFLTSITFDSLSRKIKNPCLVINKNFLKEDFTMKSKQIIIMLLSVLVFAFASCKNNENPEGGVSAPFKVSSIVGKWTSAVEKNNTFTVANDGKITITSGGQSANLTITSWNTDKDKEVSQYKLTLQGSLNSKNVDFTFTFKSANSCDLTMTGETGAENFTK